MLNKSDLSDLCPEQGMEEHFEAQGYYGMAMNCMSGSGVKGAFQTAGEAQGRQNKGQVRNKPFRLMIVGVPNVGKSSLINRDRKKHQNRRQTGSYKGQAVADPFKRHATSGYTTGILWPKFEDPKAGLDLAFCGSIKDEILDTATLALLSLSRFFGRNTPSNPYGKIQDRRNM